MSLFTMNIEGKPFLTFASQDKITADRLLKAEWLRDYICSLRHEGEYIWNGTSELFVRQAEDEEASKWEAAFTRALKEGSADDEDRYDYLVFLLPFTDPTDE